MNKHNFLTSSFVSIAVVAINLVQGILLARMLGVEGRGEFAAVMYFASFVSGYFLLGVPQVITRRNLSSTSENTIEASYTAIYAGFISGIFAFIGSCIATYILMPDDKQHILGLSLVCSICLPFTHSVLAIQALHQGRSAFDKLNITRMLVAAVFPLLLITIWVLKLDSSNVTVTVFAFLASSLVVFAFSLNTLPIALKIIPLQITKVKSVFVEGKHFAIANVASNILLRLDMLVVTMFSTLAFQGIYSVALAVSQLMIVLPNTLSLFTFNHGATRKKELTVQQILHAVLAIFIGQLISGVILYIASVLMVARVFGAQFDAAIFILPYTITAYGFIGACGVIESYMQGTNVAITQIVPKVIASAGFIAWAFWLHQRDYDMDIAVFYAVFCSLNFFLLLVVLGWSARGRK